jgi:hypothetical protein
LSGSTSKAWDELFRVLQLQDQLRESEIVTITAETIKSVTRREPRLMTKFDTRESRPSRLDNVTILPLSNGEYALLNGDGYYDVPKPAKIKVWNKPRRAPHLVTLPWDTGPASESQALDMAAAAGILDDFFGETNPHLTIRGRLRSPQFGLRFQCVTRELTLQVNGVQIEVDSGFEGERVHLVEAKLGNRTNFHVRQLYFPVRMWSAMVADKPVSAAFLTWSNRCVSIRSFRFDPIDLYQSIKPVDCVDYLLDEPDQIPTLPELIESTSPCLVSAGIPFPQADDVRRVIDMVDAIGAGVSNRAAIANRYNFHGRQADYYANAAAYLGLLERNAGGFELSPIGQQFRRAPLNRRYEIFLRQLVARPVFRPIAEHFATSGSLPSHEQVSGIVSAVTSLTGATSMRRARTALSWMRWAHETIESQEGLTHPRREVTGQYRLF